MNTIQTFQSSVGPVQFIDIQEALYSSKAQPRDTQLIHPTITDPAARRLLCEAIAADIRRAQGVPEIGLRHGLLTH